jgi:hypothetical protein
VLKTKALEGGNVKKFGLIQSKVPTDSRELTPVESAMAGYLIREGISYHSLKQEAHVL